MKNRKQVDTLMRVSALELLPFTVSPHHIREKKLRDPGIKGIMKRTPGVGLALDDNSALLVQDNRYQVLRSKQKMGVSKVFQKRCEVHRVSFKESGTIEDLMKKSA